MIPHLSHHRITQALRPRMKRPCDSTRKPVPRIKITLDLMGLGRSLARQGKRNEAKEYFQRAYFVSEGAGDSQAREATAAEIKKLAP